MRGAWPGGGAARSRGRVGLVWESRSRGGVEPAARREAVRESTTTPRSASPPNAERLEERVALARVDAWDRTSSAGARAGPERAPRAALALRHHGARVGRVRGYDTETRMLHTKRHVRSKI